MIATEESFRRTSWTVDLRTLHAGKWVAHGDFAARAHPSEKNLEKNLENHENLSPKFIFCPASTIAAVPGAMLTNVVSTATANR